MPIHRVPRATLHEDIHDIEHDGERVVSVTIDGDYILVVTEYRGADLETRGVS